MSTPTTAGSADTGSKKWWWALLAGLPVAAMLLMMVPLLVLFSGTSNSGCTPTGETSNGDTSVPVTDGRSYPLKEGTYTLTSGYGMRWGEMHRGVDFAGPIGTPIYAAMDGVVVEAGPATGFGLWIVIDSNDGGPISTVYGHMFVLSAKQGQKVKAGDKIAEVGNNGQSTGPHLHFEVWPGGRLQGGQSQDPQTWLARAQRIAGPPGPSAADAEVGLVGVDNAGADCGFGSAGGELAAGTVPPEFEPWIRKAGAICPGIKPSLLAAQLDAENKFRHGPNAPVSSTGAGGPAQFMPATWATWGKDYDGNGRIDINSIGDAVMAQGHFMCALNEEVNRGIADGSLKGDPTALTVAAYNAGSGALVRNPGNGDSMPSGGDYSTQTRPYVAKILAAQAKYASTMTQGSFVPTPGSPAGPQVAAAARKQIGVPYVWGGGDVTGPTKGGLDCSGLTSYAVFAGSAGRVTLPRTSEAQWGVGQEIPIDAAQPGDLLFGEFGSAGPGHVAVALGGGRMIHAPEPGQTVTEAAVQPGMKARRVA
ncbi:peptidoglycan DD-metalloendopeptidase family protein [Antrihabitans spumae]|uniref:Peptidoglycan DD-metalloendopeptidase family protein n=1 Tax=Antrihabitans spumae TaxID=3373370 RepID=A0ABW7KF38_9NOCA